MAESGVGCKKREPRSAVLCTRGENHRGPHAFADRVTWTDEEAQQVLALLVAQYGGIVSWVPEQSPGRYKCKRCGTAGAVRPCVLCKHDLCQKCLFIETCPKGEMGQHALPVERPT